MSDENPASVVRTARDERLWRMAKERAARQGRARDWAYVMGIFQHMKHRTGSEPVDNPADKAKWQKYGPKGADWEGEWLVTLPDGRQFRTWRDAEAESFSFVPASDTTTYLPGRPGAAVGGTWGGFTREEAERAMAKTAVQNPDDDDFRLSASRVQQGLFAESSYERKPKPKPKKPKPDTRQVDMFGLPIDSAADADDEPRENPLTELEAELSPEELQAFESMILKRYDYDVQSFPRATPSAARLALLFREALREKVGDYGWRAVKAVPAEHVSSARRPGTIALIFEDVADAADEVQFSDEWQEIERALGAELQSWNRWSAHILSARENPASVTDITGRIADRRRERRAAALSSMYDTMAADPGFQQAARRRRAEETMQRHAAGPQLFKRGDRVTYAGADGAIPASWRGRVGVYEWHPEWSDDSDGHFYTVRWTTPEGVTHEGVHHQSDLR